MPTQTGTIPTLGRMLRGRRILVVTAMLAAGVTASSSPLHLAGAAAAAPVPHLVGTPGHAVGSGETQGAAPMLVPGPIGPSVTAVAGARVNASGTVVTWFNDFGGAPQVTHTAGSGVYDITFPNAQVVGQPGSGNNVLSVTADTPSSDCTAVNADYASVLGGAPQTIEVWTKDCTQTGFADRGFHLVVFASPPAATPAGASPIAAIAGARVNASGTVLTWFNDFGGAPTVSHTAGSGLYYLNFPNAPVVGQNNGGNSVLAVTPDTPSGDCTAVNADYANSGAAVETKDCTNSFADRGFHLVVFASPPAATATGASPIAAIAGARVNVSGTVLAWFNEFGGAPQVTHTKGSGVYYLKFPNALILGQNNGGNSVLSVTPDDQPPTLEVYVGDCIVANADYANSGAATVIGVETKQCSNSFADRGFHLVVFASAPVPPAGRPPGESPTVSQYPAGVATSAGNGAQPEELTVGPDGNLWYTDEVSGVFRFSPKALGALPCSPSAPAVGCKVSANTVAPTDIVAGPDGAMWFTQSAGGNPKDGRSYFPASIGRITTAGAYSSYAVPDSARSVPGLDAITVGPNNNLWFTETAANRIGEITPRAAGPVVHEFELPAADRLGQGVGSSITSADTIATGPGNDIWFTEQGSNAIGVMSTSGALVSKFTVPNANLNPVPFGITEGPDETMWFTENAANQVASITATGKVTVYSLPGAASGPGSIIYGPDGNLWFTDNTGVGSINPGTGKVTLYPAHTASSGPIGITVGPDCTSVWFTESSADQLGRVGRIPNTTGCKVGEVPGAGAPSAAEVQIGPPRPALPPGTKALGPVPGQQQLAIVIILKPQGPALLNDADKAASTPGSPSYKHFLGKGEFGPRYGAGETAIAHVEAGLSALGLKPGEVASSDLQLEVGADVAAAERAFRVTEENYELPGGRKVFFPTSAPSLPSDIAPYVESVLGLDDVVVGRPAGRASRSLGLGPAVAVRGEKGGPVMGPLSPQACQPVAAAGGETPSALADLYDLNSFYQTGDFGQGTTIALFEESDFDNTDVSTYQSCFQTSVNVSRVRLNIGAFGAPSVGGGTDEVTGDIEDIIGLASKANVEVYEAANLPGPMVDEYQQIADDDNAQVVSTSWGLGCESLGLGSFGLWLTGPYMVAEDQIFSQMALQGQTMLAASGDMGSEACGGTGLAVNYPASDPMLTGVGGTQLGGAPPTEMVWNAACASGPCGGGGGISSVWHMPSWQKALGVPSSLSSGSPCGASPGLCREVPDVSALAGNPDYLFFCTAGNCSPGGWSADHVGTSFATPLWAAIVALMDSASPSSPEGFLNPLLYSDEGLLKDITLGDNNLAGGQNYVANVGYDMASGLGSPNGVGLCALVLGAKCDRLAINPCCTYNLGVVGQPYQATLTAEGGDPPYSGWQITGSSAPGWLSLGPTSGSFTGTPTAPGSYMFTVAVLDPVGDAASRVIEIDVEPAPPPLVTSLFPPYGPVAGGTRVTMNGTGFLGAPSSVPAVGFAVPGGASTMASKVACPTGAACTVTVPTSPLGGNGVGVVSVTATLASGQQGTCASCFAYYLPSSPLVATTTSCNGPASVVATVIGPSGSPLSRQLLSFMFSYSNGKNSTLVQATNALGVAGASPAQGANYAGGKYTVTVTNTSDPASTPTTLIVDQLAVLPCPVIAPPEVAFSVYPVMAGSGAVRPGPTGCLECAGDVSEVVWDRQLGVDPATSYFAMSLGTLSPVVAASAVSVVVEPTPTAAIMVKDDHDVQFALPPGAHLTGTSFVGPVISTSGPAALVSVGAAPNGFLRATLPYNTAAVPRGSQLEVMVLRTEEGHSYWSDAGVTTLSAAHGEISAVLPAFGLVTVAAVSSQPKVS